MNHHHMTSTKKMMDVIQSFNDEAAQLNVCDVLHDECKW